MCARGDASRRETRRAPVGPTSTAGPRRRQHHASTIPFAPSCVTTLWRPSTHIVTALAMRYRASSSSSMAASPDVSRSVRTFRRHWRGNARTARARHTPIGDPQRILAILGRQRHTGHEHAHQHFYCSSNRVTSVQEVNRPGSDRPMNTMVTPMACLKAPICRDPMVCDASTASTDVTVGAVNLTSSRLT